VNPNSVPDIRLGYNQVREKIDLAARRAGRQPESVRLVVVTKTHPLETIRMVLEAGIRDLGENYVEEAEEKILAVGTVSKLTWHMIGHIQSRKAEAVARNFEFVHSLDSLKLANRLDRFAGEAGRKLAVLLECNVSGETSKFGFSAFEQGQWEILSEQASRIAQLPNLEIRGLMTMPPLELNAEKARLFFRKMCELQAFLSRKNQQSNWSELSMGTSSDFEAAVEEGATLVRVGTAILGSRPAHQ